MPEEKPISFAADIRPLFRDIDVEHMNDFGVLLDDYAYMSQRANADNVMAALKGDGQTQMPPHGPYWSVEQLALFSRWIDAGCPP